MRIAIALMAMVLVASSKPVHAKNPFGTTTSAVPRAGEIGLGLMVGTIISGTGKYWLTNQSALDFGIGFVESAWTLIYADYLWHIPRVFGTSSKFGRESSLYFGGGGGVGFWHGRGACGHWGCDWVDRGSSNSGTGFLLRGLAGVEWYPLPTRFGVFGEAGPSTMIVPGIWTTVDVGVGGRYYF